MKIMEARVGIEPAYTELQGGCELLTFSFYINGLVVILPYYHAATTYICDHYETSTYTDILPGVSFLIE